MAFGFPAKFVQEYYLEETGQEAFMALAYEAAVQLKWDLVYIGSGQLRWRTKWSMRSFCEDVVLTISHGVITMESTCSAGQIYDWGKNKQNIQELQSGIQELEQSLTTEQLNTIISQIQNQISAQEGVREEEDIMFDSPGTQGMLSIFMLRKGYQVTPIIILLNCFVYLLMLFWGVHFFDPLPEDLVSWGANFAPLTLAEGQWWRLFTSTFLHVGLLHLMLNMWALAYIGQLLEPYLGWLRILVAYLICGVVGSLVSLFWNDVTVSAGASGAIFGLFGLTLSLLLTNRIHKSIKRAMMLNVGVFILYNIASGFVSDSGIDNAAHIGGLLSGIIVGFAFVPSMGKEYKAINFMSIGGLIFITILGTFITLKIGGKQFQSLFRSYSQTEIYQQKINLFIQSEAMALEVFRLPADTPKEKLLYELKERGLYYWQENKKLIEEIDDLQLPPKFKRKNGLLKQYCILRIASYKLIISSLEENTTKYDDSIRSCNIEIEKIIQEITQHS